MVADGQGSFASVNEQMLLDACKRVEATATGAVVPDLREQLEGLICKLGVCFGIRPSEMRGEDGDGFDTARAYVVAWLDLAREPKYRSALKPQQLTHACRRALRECKRFPSYGLLVSLGRGEDVTGYPGGVLKGDDPAPQREVHADFEALARKWEKDSRQRGLRPSESTPPDVARERLREFQALMARRFRMGEAPPPTPQPSTSKAPRESEPGEDG